MGGSQVISIKVSLEWAIAAFALGFACSAYADDPCNDSRAELRQLLKTGAPFGTNVDGPADARTITRVRLDVGDAVLLEWSYGASGFIQCTYLAYRASSSQPYRTTQLVSADGSAQVADIDGDGLDEIVIYELQSWGMECSDSMGAIPSQLRIKHLDATTGRLDDVTRTYGAFARNFLFDQRAKRESSEQLMGSSLSPNCQAKWLELTKATYESAWYVLEIAGFVVGLICGAIFLLHVKSLVWLAKIVGTAVTAAVVGAAYYSLGTYGWHFVPFNDVWSAFQFLTGFRFHSSVLELISMGVAAFIGLHLLSS